MNHLLQQTRRTVDKSGAKENESRTWIWRKLKTVLLDLGKERLSAVSWCAIRRSHIEWQGQFLPVAVAEQFAVFLTLQHQPHLPPQRHQHKLVRVPPSEFWVSTLWGLSKVLSITNFNLFSYLPSSWCWYQLSPLWSPWFVHVLILPSQLLLNNTVPS